MHIRKNILPDNIKITGNNQILLDFYMNNEYQTRAWRIF